MPDIKLGLFARFKKILGFPREIIPSDPDDTETPENRLEFIPEFRENIGARNPFVIARRKLEIAHPEADITPYKTENLKHMMETAFDGLPYEKMFDPRYGSPVYHGILPATRKLASANPGLYGESLELLTKDPAAGKPGEIPPFCQNFQRSSSQSSTINAAPTQYRNTAGGTKNNGLEFNDPVQGCIADCWLIAVLSSVAWAETNLMSPTKLARAPPISVYPPSCWATKQTITTTSEFYTADSGTKPYYGQTNTKKLVAGFYTCWPAFYEKCFAAYYQQQRTPPFSQNNDPQYSQINFGSPFAALSDITGKVTNTSTIGYTRDFFVADANTPDNDAGIIEKIRSGACGGATLNTDGAFIPTKKAAAAYTYLSASYVTAAANSAKYSPAVVYACSGMPANHAFSILGLYQESGKKFVVLRNPWGFAGDAASFTTDLQGSLARTLTSLPAPANIASPGAEGIFGISSTTFLRYFEAFGTTI